MSRDGAILGAYADVRDGGARVHFFQVSTRRADDPVLLLLIGLRRRLAEV
ncbi:MAG: hypothetical protein HYY06_22965 [Deltaproteobacteria bacterium]|nr:hypothetical protein [Deltaproteobacteria bacterium]